MTATESTPEYPEDMPAVNLASYVGASQHDQQFIEATAAVAAAMVQKRIGSSYVPPSVLSAAILAVGANLWQRRVSTIGTTAYGDPETMGNPMRPALDPMTQAWPLLRPYIGPGIA